MLVGVCLLLLATGALATDEGNVHLDQARQEIERLQYAAARSSLEKALRSGRASPTQLREILLLSAEAAAVLGDRSGAEKFYRMLLSLDPTTRLPPGASPKLAKPFAAARAAMRGGGALAVQEEHTDGQNATVTLVVVSDPLGLVHGARLLCRVPSGRVSSHTATGHGRITLSVPQVGRTEVLLSAVDRHGNRLVDIGPFIVHAGPRLTGTADTSRKAPSGLSPGTGATPPPPLPPIPRWVYATAGVTLLSLASGVTFGVLTELTQRKINDITANSHRHTYDELLSAKRRGEWEALVANVSFGVAAAGAVVLGVYGSWRFHRYLRARVVVQPDPMLEVEADF